MIFDKIGKIFKKKSVDVKNIIDLLDSKKSSGQIAEANYLTYYATNPYLRQIISKTAYICASKKWIVKDSNDKEIPSHKMIKDINSMNKFMPGLSGMKMSYLYFLVFGAAYWIFSEDDIYVASKTDIKINDGSSIYIQNSNLRNLVNTKSKDFSWYLFLEPNPNKPYDWKNLGLGVVEAIGQEINIAEKLQRYMFNMYYNNKLPPMIVTADASKEDITALKKDWLQKNHNSKTNITPYFMRATGKVNIEQIENKLTTQEIAIMKLQRDIILQSMGIPPEITGIVENSNRATIESADLIMSKYVVKPILDSFKPVLQNILMAQYEDNYTMDYESVDVQDKDYTKEIMKNHSWAFTKDEIREQAGFPPAVTDGDTTVMPINLVQTRDGKIGIMKDGEVVQLKQNQPQTEIDIEELLKYISAEAMREEVEGMFRKILVEVAQQIAEGIGSEYNPFNVHLSTYLNNELTKKVTKIAETTRSQLRSTMAEGIRNNEDFGELVSRVEHVYEKAKGYRAEMIARTESHNSVSYATHNAYKDSEDVEAEEWIHHPEESAEPRENHAIMDGQVRKIDEEFVSGSGFSTIYPGGFGVASEDINCNCTLGAIMKDKKTKQDRAQFLKQQEERRLKYIPEIREKFVEVFEGQELDILKYMREKRR